MRIDVTFEETNSTFNLELNKEECEKNFDAGFDEAVLIPTERDHAKLNNRDAPDQHPIDSITGLREALENANAVKYGESLKVINGVLDVNTADNAEKDNTLPITSAAVHTEIGNIEVLLKTI